MINPESPTWAEKVLGGGGGGACLLNILCASPGHFANIFTSSACRLLFQIRVQVTNDDGAAASGGVVVASGVAMRQVACGLPLNNPPNQKKRDTESTHSSG